MRRFILALNSLALILFYFFSCVAAQASRPSKLPQTVSHVDLKRYMGRWYEIASFPAHFQRGCHCTTATYKLLSPTKVRVINRCFKGKDYKNNQPTVAVGRAWPVADDPSLSRLKVQFFWPFSGDYWILHLSPAYSRVLVGSPDHKYLWILSRRPRITSSQYNALIRIAKRKGYDTSRLQRTAQDCWKK